MEAVHGNESDMFVERLVLLLAPIKGAKSGSALLLREDLGFHSVALVELSFLLEEAFSLDPISDQDARAILTLADVQSYVRVCSKARGYVFPDGGAEARRLIEELESWT